MATFFDREMTLEQSLTVIQVRMFEHGHSFKSIRKMSLEDFGKVLSVWQQKARVEKKRARMRKARNGKK